MKKELKEKIIEILNNDELGYATNPWRADQILELFEEEKQKLCEDIKSELPCVPMNWKLYRQKVIKILTQRIKNV